VLAPKTFRFTDLDQYRTAVRNLQVEFTPLVRSISAEQIILNLPGCDINFAKSFPRIADGQLAQNCTAIGFSMDDGLPIRFNERSLRDRDWRQQCSIFHRRTSRATIRIDYLYAGDKGSWLATRGAKLERL
jgi:hypothetical protein